MYLSASRIKTFNTCSYIYWCNYHLGLRDIDGSNDGAKRGTISHLILEVLLNNRHRKYIEQILEKGCKKVPSIWRLILKHAKILCVDDEENLKLIDSFIQVGLKTDYLCEETDTPDDPWILQDPEIKFQIENENPEYKILGFIDKQAHSKSGKKKRVDDYKTSKARFSGEDADFNIQSLLYALALWKDQDEVEKVDVNFIFLKFPKNPWQKFSYTKEQLAGFEIYLSDIYKYLKNFNIKKACSNYAKNNKNYFLCGKCKTDVKKDGSPAWVCSYKYPFLYYAVINKENKVKATSKVREEIVDKVEDGDRIEERFYAGCPAWIKY